jgi:hypothetical protein
MTIGMLAAGLLVGVLPPAVAFATPNPTPSPDVQSKGQQMGTSHERQVRVSGISEPARSGPSTVDQHRRRHQHS